MDAPAYGSTDIWVNSMTEEYTILELFLKEPRNWYKSVISLQTRTVENPSSLGFRKKVGLS